jgi:hypothetical protein
MEKRAKHTQDPVKAVYSFECIQQLYFSGLRHGRLYDVMVVYDRRTSYPKDGFWASLTLRTLDDIECGRCAALEYRELVFFTLDTNRIEDLRRTQLRHGIYFEICTNPSVVEQNVWAELGDSVMPLLYPSRFRIRRNAIIRGAIATGGKYNHTDPINISKM